MGRKQGEQEARGNRRPRRDTRHGAPSGAWTSRAVLHGPTPAAIHRFASGLRIVPSHERAPGSLANYFRLARKNAVSLPNGMRSTRS